MISRLTLSLFLLIAGVIHLMRPEFFNPAIPFSFKLQINFAAGFLEIILALLLWSKRTRDLAAQSIALWFLLLTPIHFYICLNEIPIFGISHPLLLLGRTCFQAVLFFWALSLQEKGWIMSQRWSDVLFLHYEVEPIELQKHVPYPLDLYNHKAIISIVPFVMSRIRFPFLPAIPGLSKLYELNLRTYVKVNEKAVVYFFTLDSNHLPGVLIARWFFSLPYRWKKLKLVFDKTYTFDSSLLKLEAKVEEIIEDTEFNRWTTERYALVTDSGKLGVVEHKPWILYKARVLTIKDDFSNLLGEKLKATSFIGISFAKELDVRFRPFNRLKKGIISAKHIGPK